MKPLSGGVLVPVCSPCNSVGEFLPIEFEKMMQDSMSNSLIDGAYVCGGTGEGMLMRLSERKQACEIAVSVAREHNKTTLIHIGAVSMRDALELAGHAASCGADGISTVPLPDADLNGLMDYYRAVAEVSNLPTILYYVPGCALPVEQVIQTLSVPGVIGIKSSSNDFFFTMQLMDAKPETSVLFNGKDEYLAAAVIQGADGGIGMWANVFPSAYGSIYKYAKEREYGKAFALQNSLNKLCCIAFRLGLLQSFESILRWQGRWSRVFRCPSPQFDDEFYNAFISEAKPLLEILSF